MCGFYWVLRSVWAPEPDLSFSPQSLALRTEGKGGVWMCTLSVKRSSDASSKLYPFVDARTRGVSRAESQFLRSSTDEKCTNLKITTR